MLGMKVMVRVRRDQVQEKMEMRKRKPVRSGKR